MPSDAEKTHLAILHSAQAEFLRQGFTGASLRRIAAEAGVTTGALYRHFRDKDALFAAVVSPAYDGFLEIYHAHNAQSLQNLPKNGMDPMWEGTERSIMLFLEYIYGHFEAFQLLVSCSEQTPYAHFVHALVEEEIDSTLQYMQEARKLGFSVREVGHDELHILVNAQFSCIFEMILHSTPKEEALRMVRELSRFFVAGWRAFFME